jgi:hypothetical protein
MRGVSLRATNCRYLPLSLVKRMTTRSLQVRRIVGSRTEEPACWQGRVAVMSCDHSCRHVAHPLTAHRRQGPPLAVDSGTIDGQSALP